MDPKPGDMRSGRPARLKRVSIDEPGLRRLGRKRFRYVDPDGKPVRDPATLQRIAALAIPPAYREVWICRDPMGHIQATGRDARGRLQYRYHPAWREARDRSKYRRLGRIAAALPRLRRKIMRDLSPRRMCSEAVLAAIVALLEKTLARVGSETYRRENGSFGLTTLRNSQVSVEGDRIRLRFRGKGGKPWKVALQDARVARVLAHCRASADGELFRFRDARGELRRIGAADVNRYLRDATGERVTARDFRTWAGTVMVARSLVERTPPASRTAARRDIRDALAMAAKELGNTPTVCRKAYVAPVVLQRHEAGTLARALRNARPQRGLTQQEAGVAALLGAAAQAPAPTGRSRRSPAGSPR